MIGAEVRPSGVPLMLGADVSLSRSLMVTQGGGAAVGSARVAGSGYTTPQSSQSTSLGI